MAEFIRTEEKVVNVGEPVIFENNTDSDFEVSAGIIFHKSGLYDVSVVGRRTVVSKVERTNDDAPTVPHWILCSDRLPEEHEWIGTKKFGTTISDEIYVTFETPDGQRFTKHISFQNGKLSSSDKRLMEVWYNDAKPIAWMPLPKPYKGGTE